MKRKFQKLLYSFLIFLLIFSSMPLQLVNASVQQKNEAKEEESATYISEIIDDEEYENQKLEMMKEFSEELSESESDQRSFSMSSSGGTIENDYLSIALGHDGRFTMGTTGGNPDIDTDNNKTLLYGHPNPWSSYTTIRVNGNDHIFNASDSVVDHSKQEIIATQVIDNVEVKQILTFSRNATTNRADIGSIRYELTNNGGGELTAGTRIMLDTMLGRNDGAPFRVPGLGDVLYERELVGSQIPQYWQAFDDLDNPDVVANGTFYQSAHDRPDKVQFVYWADIYGTDWDYDISSDTSVTRDSAVAIYHNPTTLAPGETRVINTYYGIGDFAASDMDGPLSVRITAPQELAVDKENANYFSNPFTITGYVRNVGSEKATNTTVSLELPKDSGLTVLTPEDPTISLDDLNVGEEEIVTWTVLAASQSSDTTVDYSIKVNASNMDEKVLPLSILLPEVSGDSTGTITLNKDELYLNIGESETLRATLDGISGRVTWLSDNPNVATVNSSGKVTAKAGGTANIIATAGGQIATAKVIVNGDPVPVEGISFSQDTLELHVGQTKRLNVKFSPEYATNKRIASWETSHPFVARVSNGIVKAVTPGIATITAISEEGKHVASITVKVTEAEPSLGFGNDISFSENVFGPTISFLRNDFTLFELPVELELQIKDKVKFVYDSSEDKFVGYFGDLSVTGTDDRNDDDTLTEEAKQLRKDAYREIKDLMNKLGKSTNRDFYNAYRRLIRKDGGFVIKGSQTYFGFVELANTGDGRYALTDGQFAALHTAGFNMRYRFPAAPVAYLRFGVTGSLQSGLRLKLHDAGNLAGGMDVFGSFNGKLTPGLGLGAGYDHALRLEAGLEGTLDSTLNFPFTRFFNARDDLKLGLSAQAYLEFQALLFLSGRGEWTFADYQLYPRQSSNANSRHLNINIDDADSFELMPRDYVSQSSHFQANRQAFSMQSASSSSGISSNVIKDNVYPYGSPVLTNLPNGDQLLVWVDDDNERTSANRTALYYSIYDGSKWSDPKQVDNDGTADFEPRVVVHNDDVYLAWQNVSKALDDDVSLEEMFDALEINVARFDGEQFVDVTQLTEGENIPATVPKLASNGSSLSVVWTISDGNDLESLSDASRIVEAVYTDAESSWSKPQVVTDAESPITEFDVAYDNDERIVAYGTGEDIYLVKGKASPVQLMNDEGINRLPIFSSTTDGTDLYWYSNDGIKYMKNLNDRDVQTIIAVSEDMGKFDVVTNDQQKMLYYEQEDGFKTNVYGVYYDEENAKWGEPIELINEDRRLRDVNGLMDDNGHVTFVYNSVEVHEENFDTDQDLFGQVDLMATTIAPFTDIAILSNINFNVNDVIPGEDLPLSFDVANVGQQTVEGIKVDIYQNDELVHSEDQDLTLLSGEEDYVEVNYPLPEELNEHQVTVKVLPFSTTDVNLDNNEAEVTVGHSNIEVIKPVVSGDGDKRTVQAEVKNIGYNTAKDIQVNFVMDELDGDVIATRELGEIAPQSSRFVEFEIDMNDMNFEPNSDDIVLYVIAEGDEEFQHGSHYNFTKLTNPYDDHVLQISEVGIAGNNLVFTIHNNIPEDVEGTILVQAIHDGVQETIGQTTTFQSLYGHSMQFDISSLLNNMDESGIIRLFVVDENDVTISNTIDIGEKVESPQSSPESGTYADAQSVVLYTMTQNADIYYTTDGSDPTTDSEQYVLPIEVTETTTIKAIAVKSGQTTSDVAELEFVIDPDAEQPGDGDGADPGDGDGEEPGDGDGDGTDPGDGDDTEGPPGDSDGDNDDDTSKTPGDPGDDGTVDDDDDGTTPDDDDGTTPVSTDDPKARKEKDDDGKKLPKTATNMFNIIWIGTLLLGIGLFLLIRSRQRRKLS